jgi:hypothetical protein
MSDQLEQFAGTIVRRGEATYDLHCYQYAYSSHGTDGHMQPAAVLYPTSSRDVALALAYAARQSLRVAVRSGGHHLLGASSTSGAGLLMDLRDTYRAFEWDAARNLLRVGVSHSLDSFNAQLGALGLFLPHGQCSHVRLGGHVQTGGWGMMARSYGLLSDYVVSMELISADGTERVVHRDSPDLADRELFFATMGGSPGRFGLLTHVTFCPLRDSDHPNARGLKFLLPYSRDRLEALLDVMVEMASDDNFDGDFDYSVTVLGGAQVYPPFATGSGLDEQMRVKHPELYGQSELRALPAGISVYAQWGNTGGASQVFDPTFFNRIKAAARYGAPTAAADAPVSLARLAELVRPRALLEKVENRVRLGPVPVGLGAEAPIPLSVLARNWVFPNVREFNLAYIKRTYITNSTSLQSTGWAKWVSDRFDVLVRANNGCKGFLQVQHMGGRRSQFRQKGLDGATSHSWRQDATLCCLMDCFYDDHPRHARSAKQTAMEWQQQNDAGALGQQIFSDRDRRVFWGPWGDLDFQTVWPHYLDSPEKYERLRAIQRQVDPTGLFSANGFGVR